jgi:hypothetical protein
MPFCSLQWPDEHPEDRDHVILDPKHEECRTSIIRLVGARTYLWREGVIPEDLHELWSEAQRAIPGWPGFKRLSLDEQQLRSLDGCAEELDDFIGRVAQDFPRVTFKDKGGGLTEFSAHRERGAAAHQPPMLVTQNVRSRIARVGAAAISLPK